MVFNIRGDKVEVTKSIKEYIEDKLSKLDKYFDKGANIKGLVIIRVKNGMQTIEVTVPTSRFTLRAEESHEDLYAAIDLIIDKLERMIRKNKTRLTKHYKNVPQFEMSFDYEGIEEETNNKIAKRKDIDTKPMGEEEAILHTELLNHDFLIYLENIPPCPKKPSKRRSSGWNITTREKEMPITSVLINTPITCKSIFISTSAKSQIRIRINIPFMNFSLWVPLI